MMDQNSTNALKTAVQLAKQNKISEAKSLLRKLLLTEKENDKAWTLLGMLSTSDRERINCYRQALRINPQNTLARKNLQRHEPQRDTAALRSTSITKPEPEPVSEPLSDIVSPAVIDDVKDLPTPIPATEVEAQNNQRDHWRPRLALCILTGILLGIAGYQYFGDQLSSYKPIIHEVAAAENYPMNDHPRPISTEEWILDDLTEESSVILFTPTATVEEMLTATPTETKQPPPTITANPTNTLTPTATPTTPPTATPLPPIPDSASVTVRGTDQLRALSCESSAAVDWARYYGTDIGEIDFHNNLPKSDNPEIGFVGNVNGYWGQIPPNPYGVHAEPVAALLRSYGLHAEAVKNLTMDELKREIANGNPVIIWFIGKGWTAVQPTTYFAEDGSEVTVAPYEHVALAVGYGPDSITILDGTSIYYRSDASFDQSWAALNRMAIIYRD